MKVDDNGILRDMTAEEITEWGQLMANMPKPELSHDDRMTQIEAALIELAAMLGGGA